MGLKQNIHIYMVWGPPSPLSPWPRNGPGLDSTLAKKVNDQHSDYNKPIILNNSLQEIQQLEKNSTLFYYFFFLLKILVQLFSFFLLFFTFCLFFSFCFSLFFYKQLFCARRSQQSAYKITNQFKENRKEKRLLGGHSGMHAHVYCYGNIHPLVDMEGEVGTKSNEIAIKGKNCMRKSRQEGNGHATISRFQKQNHRIEG